jgi:uncharacterized tellurite resistance protein B-like protein
MSNHHLVKALAKVIIAAAWADGALAADEVNNLKDLIARLPQIGTGPDMQLTATEWAELEIYLHSPVGPAERARLVADLQAALRGPRDRQTASAALEEMIGADEVVAPEERAVADEIRAALESVDLGIISRLGRLLRGPLQQRPAAVADAPNREQFLDDFLRNRIYFGVRQRLHMAPDADLGLSEDEARKLSLMGGLLAYVARVDNAVTASERDTLEQTLQHGWGISDVSAALVAEVALSEIAAGLDFFRLTSEFAAITSEEERAHFLDALFAVAAADGQVSVAENSEISRIAYSINLTRDHFSAARRRSNAPLNVEG